MCQRPKKRKPDEINGGERSSGASSQLVISCESVTSSESVTQNDTLAAYNTAVRLLGRRDHSVHELVSKLQRREYTDEAIQSALSELADLNYVNDARYALLYVEQRLGRGYGPLYIKARLRERGVASHLVDAALAEQSISWPELAQSALERRFDTSIISSRDKRDEGRMARFLASRGFSSADALRALNSARQDLR